MLLITQFGEETAFLVIALILFWCIDKYKGYFILSVGFIGTLSNQFLKLVFRIPRPWVVDSDFSILEQAREAAAGYSFPSGHTQSAVGTFGGIAYISKSRIIKCLGVIIAILVAFSRMYIGVHTPQDVFVSAAIAMLLIVILKPLMLDSFQRTFPYVFAVMLTICVGFLCYVELYNFPADIDLHNLASGVKNAYTLAGCLIGLLIVYILDEKWLNFPTEAIWWVQILKVIGGLAIVLAVKTGLKTPLNFIFGESLGRAARYMLIVLVAGVIWPLTFRLFKKLGES
jgi:undecaprenyl-diphosphatase